MTADEVFDEISRVLSEELGVSADRVTLAANLSDDLEMDSLDRTEFLVVLEKRLGRSMDAIKAEEAHTVQDVVDMVVALSSESPRA